MTMPETRHYHHPAAPGLCREEPVYISGVGSRVLTVFYNERDRCRDYTGRKLWPCPMLSVHEAARVKVREADPTPDLFEAVNALAVALA